MMEDPSAPEEDLSVVQLIERFDSQDLLGLLRRWVDDLRSGFASVNEERFPWLATLRRASWSGVLCLGMGGSGAGGDFLAALNAQHGPCPVMVHRDYTLPAWFDPTWLVLATSHSGNTEETVSAAEAALKQGAVVIVISTGGVLAGLTELYPHCYLIPTVGGQPPRTAFGHLFSRQLACLEHLGLAAEPVPAAREAMLQRLQQANEQFDVARDPEGDIALLATSLLDQPIAALGPTELTPALVRFKNQMNENAARFARIGVLPEMNHNESVAWGGVGPHHDPNSAEQGLLFLTWSGMHPRVRQRLDWMVAHTTTETAWNLVGEGSSLLESLLYHCLVMDWLSITLALLQGKDPSTIQPIDAMKAHLDSVQ